MNKIYFIAGASGSGKTAILKNLQKALGNTISVYDFDDIGVPENADTQWRQKATEQWLQKLLAEKKDACLLGQMVLGEILACPSAKKLGIINFCLLDVSDYERIKRLRARNTYLSEKAQEAMTDGSDQNMLNWASWLRMHHQDPQWEQHVVTHNSWENLNFSPWNTLTNWGSLAHVKIFDTTELSINDVTVSVANIINPDYYPIKKPPSFDLSVSTAEEQHFIDYALGDYNMEQVAATQTPVTIPLSYCFKDQKTIIAGITAELYIWKILHIDILFVDKNYRQNNLGSYLLRKVETEAKALGAKLAHIDTYDFQAKHFYLKHGYEIFGVLENCPEGHKRYYLKKFL